MAVEQFRGWPPFGGHDREMENTTKKWKRGMKQNEREIIRADVANAWRFSRVYKVVWEKVGGQSKKLRDKERHGVSGKRRGVMYIGPL